MFHFFLAVLAGLAVICFCLPHQTGCPQSSALCQPISLPKKRKTHGAGKTKRTVLAKFCSYNALYPEKLSEMNGVALIYAREQTSGFELGKVDRKC